MNFPEAIKLKLLSEIYNVVLGLRTVTHRNFVKILNTHTKAVKIKFS